MTGIELFCGKGVITSTFRAAGWEMISLDNRKRKGVCEPTIKLDILNARPGDFPKRPGFVCASPPCPAFSNASGNYYFDSLIPKENAKHFIKLLQHTLYLIEEINPEYFFIENPRGRMRYNKSLIDFLVKQNGMTKQLTWGSYGFPTTKPTDIFTNALDFKVRKMLPYGRGAKNHIGTFNNMTVCQRQEIPVEFARDLLVYMERKEDLSSLPQDSSVKYQVQTPGELLRHLNNRRDEWAP